jgi:integrase
MGRPVEGWKLKWRDGWASVRFTHAGRQHVIALGTQDGDEATRRAAYEYAEVVSGRRVATQARPSARLDLAELIALWIEAQDGSLDEETCATLETYGRHYVQFFSTLDRMTAAGCADYCRARLRQVLRKTVQKERVFLTQFLRWAHEQQAIGAVPEIPPLPKKATGVRAGRQRATPVETTAAEVRAILEALPEFSKRIGGRRWPVRDRFVFAYETSLRPGSVEVIEVPTHWAPGSRELVLADDEDKARFGRTLDLTPAAVAVLEAHVPRGPDGHIGGLVFGAHNFNKALKAAAKAVLGEVRGKAFAPYDFRHGRAQHLVDAGAPLRGVAYLLGHRRLTTTDRYLRPDRREGQRALAAAAAGPGEFQDNSRTRTKTSA